MVTVLIIFLRTILLEDWRITEDKVRMNKLKKLAYKTAKLKINGFISAKKYINLYKNLL